MNTAARRLESWIAELAATRGFRVRFADGRALGAPPAAASFTVTLRSARARSIPGPASSPLALGQAWIDGAFDLEGDIFAAMDVLHGFEPEVPALAMRALGLLRRLTRRWRDARRDIASHYDVPSAFYELFLDERMVYTCAYYRDPEAGLDEAQCDKLDLVCRKLRLSKDEEFLDIGCGWGGLAIWAAANYGVRARGVTLSKEQAVWAAAAAGRAGLEGRVTIEHLDYRSLPADRRYDKIAAVGVIEHVGRGRYGAYFERVGNLLRDDGLFLNHGITMRAGASWSSEMEFLHRHVFPGLDLVDVAFTLAQLERSGLEIVDVENLRPHYARTTREWAQRLWLERDAACAIAGERTWRTWVAYLAAASVAFGNGWIGLHQVVATRACAHGDGSRIQLREDVYAGDHGFLYHHHTSPSAASSSSQ